MSPFFDELEHQLRAAGIARTTRRPWWRRRHPLALVAVAGLGLGTPAVARVSGIWDPGVEPRSSAITAVTVSASASTTCKPAPAPNYRLPAGARLDPEIVAHIAVLRRPQRAGDQRPTPARPTRDGGPIVDRATSRYVGTVAGKRFYVVGARSSVHAGGCGEQPATKLLDLCLLEARGGGGCGIPLKSFLEHGMWGSSGAGEHRSTVVGLVPDDVAEVTLRYGTSERSFTVQSNFYGFEIATSPEVQPSAVIWTLRDGTRRAIR